jgi:hypothetical protein
MSGGIDHSGRFGRSRDVAANAAIFSRGLS